MERLERANATLRAKGRDSARAARDAAARIAELEDEVARLRREQDGAQRGRRSGGSARRSRPRRERDPGDAVPPGAAVEEPEPPDMEAETARVNLEHHLGDK